MDRTILVVPIRFSGFVTTSNQREGTACSQSGGSATTFSSLGSSIQSAGQLAEWRCLGGGGAERDGRAPVADAGAGSSSSRSGSSKHLRDEERADFEAQIKRAVLLARLDVLWQFVANTRRVEGSRRYLRRERVLVKVLHECPGHGMLSGLV